MKKILATLAALAIMTAGGLFWFARSHQIRVITEPCHVETISCVIRIIAPCEVVTVRMTYLNGQETFTAKRGHVTYGDGGEQFYPARAGEMEILHSRYGRLASVRCGGEWHQQLPPQHE